MKHTPGPWASTEVDESGGYDCLTAGIRVFAKRDGETLAELDMRHYGQGSCSPISHDSPGFQQFLANARLIAAAPNLLAALERAVASEALNKADDLLARAAIARATRSAP